MKKQENVSYNQEKNPSVETNLEVTDGEIRYKPKTTYKYIHGFKDNHVNTMKEHLNREIETKSKF